GAYRMGSCLRCANANKCFYQQWPISLKLMWHNIHYKLMGSSWRECGMSNVDHSAALPLMLKKLRLATIRAHWQELANKAIHEHWPPEYYLSELCQMELAVRGERRLQRHLKEARLPTGKNLASFDFTAVQGVNKAQVYDLINQTDWLNKGSNLLVFGASGLGKTHLASCIGYGLLEQGYRVKFISARELTQQLQRAKKH